MQTFVKQMPPREILVALSVGLVLWPLVARAFGSVIGTYTMFSHIERYHLDLSVDMRDGNEAITLRSLAPHLSIDARRTLLPADGYAAGADQADIVASGLMDLARLLCDVVLATSVPSFDLSSSSSNALVASPAVAGSTL